MEAELTGPVQNEVVAVAQEAGMPVPMPDDANKRACIHRLRHKGVLDVSFDGARYWLAAGVKVMAKPDLLTRLKEGPLSTDDWAEVAASRNSLKVRIHKLRQAGHKIEAQPLPRDRRSNPPVLYILVD